jgi:hypothetical protein
MATYTQTGIGIAGGWYPAKAGSSTSARVGSGSDARTAVETGTGIIAETSGGGQNTYVDKAGTAISGNPAGITFKAGKGIAGNLPLYVKTGAGVTARVASGARVSSVDLTKEGSGVTGRSASGARAGTSGKTGGNMVPPYGGSDYGDDDYGDDAYGGFRNDARRIASGTYILTSPPTIFAGFAVSGRSASGASLRIYGKTGTGSSARTVGGDETLVYGKTGGNMVEPYGTVAYGQDDYGGGWYGGFRNDGRRIASGFEEKAIGRTGTGVLTATTGGYFVPGTVSGDVEITEADDIILVVASLATSDSDEVVLTVTES